MSREEHLGKWLRRLLVRQRFRPLTFWLRDKSRVDVARREDMRVHIGECTVEVATHDGWREILLEDVRALAVRPRAVTSSIP
jgi:hypothetical protein